ncbi:hypothetical protein BGX26_011722 [Mortierella sp. AD094]|nr:hypothetical protein BGX26_011722 [Mortierella sp. AD094]
MIFGLSNAETYTFTVRAKELPVSPIKKTIFIPELLDIIMYAVKHSYNDTRKAQESIRRLRLVSRAFYQAAQPYFAVYIDKPLFESERQIVTDYRLFKTASIGYGELEPDKRIPRIRGIGSFVRSLNLKTDGRYSVDVIEVLGECCPNVEEITFTFLEHPSGIGIAQPDYFQLLRKWSGHNNIKKVTALMTLQTKNFHGTANFTDEFDKVRGYLTGVDTLSIKVENPFARHTDKDPDVSGRPIDWLTFKGFFRSFSNLVSFDLSGIHVKWNESKQDDEEISFLNLTRLSLFRGGLDIPIIGRLNRMFPKLEYLATNELVSKYDGDGYEFSDEDSDEDNDLEDQEEEDGTSSFLIASVAKSFKLTVKSIRIERADVDNLYELLKVAPVLKDLSCCDVKVRGNPKESPENLIAALRPFNSHIWENLDLGSLGKFKGKELKEFLPVDVSTLALNE